MDADQTGALHFDDESFDDTRVVDIEEFGLPNNAPGKKMLNFVAAPLESKKGVTYQQLLDAAGIDEEEPPMQVKASPHGPWCKPAVGRAMTCCGKHLGAYALRDESYLDELCTDGCFAPFELSTLAPAAREAVAAAKRKKDADDLERWNRDHDARSAKADERRKRKASEPLLFPLPVPRKSDVEDS